MTIFSVRHETTYRYANPVTLGEHRMMLRPRDSHDLRLLSATLAITPKPTQLRWMHDVFGNSVAIASFGERADELRIESRITLEQFPTTMPDVEIEEYARTYPFSYAAAETPDLSRSIERHSPDPEHQIDLWTKQFMSGEGAVETMQLLSAMNSAIHGFTYTVREEEGVQNPAETLTRQSGSCRDFAVLLMEAARTLGIAARFVSGYLGIAGTEREKVSGQSTHAWAQLYLPGAGWVDFDPTNDIVGGENLIRVAWAREPSQAMPVTGVWTGASADFLGLTVDVSIEKVEASADAPATPTLQPA